MQKTYDRGIYTGWALISEMIEREDFETLPQLARHLSGICRSGADARTQLVIDHAGAMIRTIHTPKNVAKGDWKDEPLDGLLNHLDEEIGEFLTAVWGAVSFNKPIERVVAEGSDVSLVVAMIADKLRAVG